MEARRGRGAGRLGDVVLVDGVLRRRSQLLLSDVPANQLVDGRTEARLAWKGAVLHVSITITKTYNY